MKYRLTLETDSIEEIFLTVSTLRAPSTVVLENNGEEPVKEKKTRKAKVETSSGAVEATIEDNKVTSITVTAPVKNNVSAETNAYDAVKKATLDLIKAKGKPAALELLAEFEVKAATELKESDYDAYVNRANILLGKAA